MFNRICQVASLLSLLLSGSMAAFDPDNNNVQMVITFPEMRSSPSVAKSGNLRILHAGTATTVNSVAASHLARTTAFIEPLVTSGLTQGEGCILTADNDSTGKITLTAEL